VDSFEADLTVPAIGEHPFRAVFIRAPYILSVGSSVEVLASFKDKIVFARQGRLLAAAFHPELTKDKRIHRYFLDNCIK
jgi:5'-phosphate synthase pdxT subunit